jgi:hypothetical protein
MHPSSWMPPEKDRYPESSKTKEPQLDGIEIQRAEFLINFMGMLRELE